MEISYQIYRKKLAHTLKQKRKYSEPYEAKKILQKAQETRIYQDAKENKNCDHIFRLVHYEVEKLLSKIPLNKVQETQNNVENAILQALEKRQNTNSHLEDSQLLFYNDLFRHYSLLSQWKQWLWDHFMQLKSNIHSAQQALQILDSIQIYEEYIDIAGVSIYRKNIEHTHHIPSEHPELKIIRWKYYFSWNLAKKITWEHWLPSEEHWKHILENIPGENTFQKSFILKHLLDLQYEGYACPNKQATWKEWRKGFYWNNDLSPIGHNNASALHIENGYIFPCSQKNKEKKLSVRALYIK